MPAPRKTRKAHARHRRSGLSLSFKLGITARQGKRFVPFLQKHLSAARKLVKADLQDLSLALVGDAEMSEIHQYFLGIAKPTDVLSFELEYNSKDRVTAGEVVVCIPQARRQAHAG